MEIELKLISSQSKKELVASATKEAQSMIDLGLVDIPTVLLTAKKLIEYSNSLIKGLESSVRAEVGRNSEGLSIIGAKFTLGSTGDRLDYMEDDEYARLHNELKDREAVLKMAFKMKDVFYDSEGIEIPKVGIKIASRETLKVTF